MDVELVYSRGSATVLFRGLKEKKKKTREVSKTERGISLGEWNRRKNGNASPNDNIQDSVDNQNLSRFKVVQFRL